MLREPRVSPAPMATATGVIPSPPPPPPPPASLARARLALSLAADAVMCLCLASMWLTFTSTVASDIGCIAYGEGGPVLAAAFVVRRVSLLSYALASPVALLLFTVRMADSCTEVEEAPAPKSVAEAMREMLRNHIVLGVLASVPFIVLMFVGDVAKGNSPDKGSRRDRICSLIIAVGALGADAMYCFLVGPTLTRMMWRTNKYIR